MVTARATSIAIKAGGTIAAGWALYQLLNRQSDPGDILRDDVQNRGADEGPYFGARDQEEIQGDIIYVPRV